MTYHFTPADYDKIVEAARKSDEWRDNGTNESLVLELDSPRVMVRIVRYLDIRHVEGAVYHGAYGREVEYIPHVEREIYTVTDFAYYDENDNDQPSDFSPRRLCGAFDPRKANKKCA